MASNPYVKSLIWLVSLGGIGYGLLKLTTPSEEKIERIKSSGSRHLLAEREEKKALFMKRLQEAAIERPIYSPPTNKKPE